MERQMAAELSMEQSWNHLSPQASKKPPAGFLMHAKDKSTMLLLPVRNDRMIDMRKRFLPGVEMNRERFCFYTLFQA